MVIPFIHSPMVSTTPTGVDTTISYPKSSTGTLILLINVLEMNVCIQLESIAQ